jgi:hypothetical protein
MTKLSGLLFALAGLSAALAAHGFDVRYADPIPNPRHPEIIFWFSVKQPADIVLHKKADGKYDLLLEGKPNNNAVAMTAQD